MNNREIINKWDKSGLLDELDDNDKNKLSPFLEELYRYLMVRTIFKTITPFDEFFNNTILIVSRMLFDNLSEYKPMPDVMWLINDYDDYLTENKLFPINFSSAVDDVEDKICCDYVDRVVKMDYE